ncbi:hypothetical protein G9A89_015412 [Geosiphon pyriformis]|nr:hypothetical protein G9A89_015412 [Geosiphon pyriformis]
MTTSALREDRRVANELRAMKIAQNVIKRVDGSGEFCFGFSSVICSIYGPAEVKIRDEKLDKATIDVIYRPLIGVSGTKEKTNEFNLRTTFETIILSGLHPRTQIQIVVQIKHDDGSTLSAAINAASVALIHAGIPMKAIVVAITCIVNKEKKIYLDPTAKEMEKAISIHTFAYETLDFNVAFCESSGLFTEQEYFECYEICKSAAREIYNSIREAIAIKLQKEFRRQEDTTIL